MNKIIILAMLLTGCATNKLHSSNDCVVLITRDDAVNSLWETKQSIMIPVTVKCGLSAKDCDLKLDKSVDFFTHDPLTMECL